MNWSCFKIRNNNNVGKLLKLHYSGKRNNSNSASLAPLVCGLEIHVQLKTKRKLFSESYKSINSEPNSQVSFYDLALPGTEPKLNKYSIYLSLLAAISLNCEINYLSYFDRKHYFYPDQPAGYQITQYYQPFAVNGQVILKNKLDHNLGHDVPIRIEKIQIEQDTGKTSYYDEMTNLSSTDNNSKTNMTKHDDNITNTTTSYVDYNRTNVPLIEIVTKPDFNSSESVISFIKKLQTNLRFIGVCSGELESGAMRVDVNVSIGTSKQRVEIKNLSTLSAIKSAIEFEHKRQSKVMNITTSTSNFTSPSIKNETRGFLHGKTYILRDKEVSADYRYMRDPELKPLKISKSLINQIRNKMEKDNQFPDKILDTLLNDPSHKLRFKDAKNLIKHPNLYKYYMNVYKETIEKIGGVNKLKSSRDIGNWIANNLLGLILDEGVNNSNAKLNTDENTKEIANVNSTDTDIINHIEEYLSCSKMASFLYLYETDKIHSHSGKILLKYLIENPKNNKNIEEIAKDLGLLNGTSNNNENVKELCKNVIKKYPKQVEQIKSGKLSKLNLLIGDIMSSTKGKYNPKEIKEALAAILGI